MNKQDLIGQVADRAGLTRSDASKAVETMLEVVTSALKRGDEVRLRNPRTGAPMQIKASSQPKFRPGRILKEAVQSK
jgi:DNA-binding protein HU-beta